MAGWRADWLAIHLPLLAGCAWLGTDADWLAGFGRNQDVEPTGAIERDLAPLPAHETWLPCPAREILVRWGAPLAQPILARAGECFQKIKKNKKSPFFRKTMF